MPLSLTSTAFGTSPDYQKYLADIPTKSDRINDPDLLDFTLASTEDPGFVKLVRGNYIIFQTSTYGTWFTGYITNDPEPIYAGENATHQPVWTYKYEATSDDIILNHQPLGYIPPYINTTQGKILKDLVRRLDPTLTFNTTGIQDGVSIAYYAVDPQKKFGEIVKEFGDASFYRFWARNHALFFRAADADLAGIIIDGNDKHFTPANLQIQQSKQDIVNDVTVLGEVEAQSYMNEYFIGDAFTAKFPLLAGVYGITRSIMLDETFTGSAINGSIWDVVGDPGAAVLVVSNGYLNCLGGNNLGALDIYLESVNTIALEGNMRLTHGEWDFVSASSGVIAGLWTQAPSTALTGCIYGLKCTKSSATTVITPVVNSVEDLAQSFIISDYTKRYVFRTLVDFQHLARLDNRYSYVNSAGVVSGFGGTSVTDQPRFTTIITTINPTNGTVLAVNFLENVSSPLLSSQLSAFYVPIATNDMHATVTSITLSRPIDAYLEEHTDVRVGFNGTGFQKKMIGPNDLDAQDGYTPVATIVDAGGGSSQTKVNLQALTYNPSHASLEYFKDSAKQTSDIPAVATMLHLAYRRAGLAIGRVIAATSISSEAAAWGDSGRRAVAQKNLSPLPRNSQECELAAAVLVGDGVYQHYEGTYEQHSLFSFTSEPVAGTILKFQNLPAGAFPGISNEIILDVTTELVSAKPQEIFKHSIKFGRAANVVNRVLSTLGDAPGASGSLVPQDTVESATAIDITAVGTTFAPNVLGPYLKAWDSTNFTYDTGQPCPIGGGFEIRYTDASWGTNPAKNLVSRVTSGTTFTVPRTNRGKTAFLKAYDASGNYSRYSSGLRANLPLIPPAPVAVINTYDQTAPKIEITLPANLIDVWGYEIRGADNSTVLEKKDLTDSAGILSFTVFGNQDRILSYYVYTYNLLGEYSPYFNATKTLSDASVTAVAVDDLTMNVTWVGTNATGYVVEIDNISSAMTHITLSARTGEDQVFKLPELHFFEQRWIAVTPFDDLGYGSTVVISHMYTPHAPISFDADEVISVQPPTSATSPAPVPPSIDGAYNTDYAEFSSRLLSRINIL